MLAAVVPQHASADCEQIEDPNGIWTGSVAAGGNYKLTCNNGFAIVIGRGDETVTMLNQTISCPASGAWDEIPTCVNWDNCAGLKNNCGEYGVCVDDVAGYHCECEDGVRQLPALDGSGEMVCGYNITACRGIDCGSHGVCVELEDDADGEVGTLLNKCSCEHGYHDNGTTCVPNDCGHVEDKYGTWEGVPRVDGEYTLFCDTHSFIAGSVLRSATRSCPKDGVWPSDMPRCINAFRENLDAEFQTFRWWFALCCATLCIVGAAVAAGLTMGLMSLSQFDLRLLGSVRSEECSSTQEVRQLKLDRQAASRVQPLLKDHHRLLVTLLLLNSIANEALPIFLDQIMPAYMAVIISVTCVLFLGEILPSAIFTGPSQLSIAAVFSPLVRCLQLVFCPLAVPLKQLLDVIVGHADEGPKYTRAQLKALLRLHMEGAPQEPEHDAMNTDESDGTDSSYSKDLTSQRLLTVEEGVRSDCMKDQPECSLSRVECVLAQQSLDLSRLQLRSLRLKMRPFSAGAGETPMTILDTATVAEALEQSMDDQPGQLLLVLGEQRAPLGTITREALLWRALMSPGI